MTEKLAGQLAVGINSPMRIYLSGDLGGGKTLWTRALLRALGETGRVPSPSFALAFSYQNFKRTSASFGLIPPIGGFAAGFGRTGGR